VAGYSGTVLPKKLGITEGSRVALVGAPEGFERALVPLPAGVRMLKQPRSNLDVVVFFVTRRAELARRFPRLAAVLQCDGGLWVAWPKRTAGVATDLCERDVREVGLEAGLVDNKVCAVDDVWSSLRFVYRLCDRPAGARRNGAARSARVGTLHA
jgi:hypothetical protein